VDLQASEGHTRCDRETPGEQHADTVKGISFPEFSPERLRGPEPDPDNTNPECSAGLQPLLAALVLLGGVFQHRISVAGTADGSGNGKMAIRAAIGAGRATTGSASI